MVSYAKNNIIVFMKTASLSFWVLEITNELHEFKTYK